MDNGFILPDSAKSILTIPNSILSHYDRTLATPPLRSPLLNNMSDNPKTILFVLDGLGFNLWDREAKHSNLAIKISQGHFLDKITTIFPSSTAPAITTLNTGLHPAQHGMIEWNMYLQEIKTIVETLPFRAAPTPSSPDGSPLPTEARNLLLGSTKTIYEKLSSAGVKSLYFVPEALKEGAYTQVIAKGAQVVTYTSLADLSDQLQRKVEASDDKEYYYVYWDKIDKAEHKFGVESQEAEKEFHFFFDTIEREFIQKLDTAIAQKTTLILTADHGQITVDPTKTTYLNQYPWLLDLLQRDSDNRPILPTGGARCVQLYVKDALISKAESLLSEVVGDIATIITTKSPLWQTLFGPDQKSNSRIGNILILPKANHTIWYKYTLETTFAFKGHHGGLSASEMYVPLIVARISDLA